MRLCRAGEREVDRANDMVRMGCWLSKAGQVKWRRGPEERKTITKSAL